MNAHEYLDVIVREADALGDAAAACTPDAPVPSCPRWDVAKLLEHVGRVHRWAAANAQRAPDAEPWWSRDVDVDLPVGHAARVQWVRDGARELVRALDRPPETPAWAFVPRNKTVGFWQRRQAHETAVHRWDAQLAAGQVRPIEGALAVDGIDETLEMIPVRRSGTNPSGAGEMIRLRSTDSDGGWLVRLTPDGLEHEHEHESAGASADVYARGTASDLLLLLWSRVELSAVEVHGDADLLARVLADIRM